MAVLDNGLTINDCRLAAEVGSGTDDRGIPVTPIISIASEDTGFSSLNQHLGAIAIVFDFVDPVLALSALETSGACARAGRGPVGAARRVQWHAVCHGSVPSWSALTSSGFPVPDRGARQVPAPALSGNHFQHPPIRNDHRSPRRHMYCPWPDMLGRGGQVNRPTARKAKPHVEGSVGEAGDQT